MMKMKSHPISSTLKPWSTWFQVATSQIVLYNEENVWQR